MRDMPPTVPPTTGPKRLLCPESAGETGGVVVEGVGGAAGNFEADEVCAVAILVVWVALPIISLAGESSTFANVLTMTLMADKAA